MAKDIDKVREAAAAAAQNAPQEQDAQRFARSTPSARDEIPAPRTRVELDDDEPVDPSKPPQLTKEELAAAAAITGEAFIVVNEGRMICRPPPGVALHTLGNVVLGNVVATIDGKSVTIKHGTPVRGLPEKLLAHLRRQPEVRVGRIPTPAEKAAAANLGG